MFQIKQELFSLQAWGKTRKLTMRAYDTVAGDDNGDGIFGIGHAHGPTCLGVANGCGDVLVGAHLSIRDGAQYFPHLLLKYSALGVQGDGKGCALAFEIFQELISYSLKQGVMTHPCFWDGEGGRAFICLQVKMEQSVVGSSQDDRAQGSGKGCVIHG